MGTMLNQVSDKPTIKPPRIVIHGKGGVGKTTFASNLPDVLFMPLEEGLGTITAPHLPQPGSYVEVMNALAELANEEHPATTRRTVEDPIVGPYDRLSPKLHKWAKALLYEWAGSSRRTATTCQPGSMSRRTHRTRPCARA